MTLLEISLEELELGKIKPQMALSDRCVSSGSSAPAKVTAARQSSAATTVAGSIDDASRSVCESIRNDLARISVEPPLTRVSARRPTTR